MKKISKSLVVLGSLVLVNVNAEINTSFGYDSIEGALGTRVPYIENDANLCQVSGFEASVVTPVIISELTQIGKYKTITAKDPNYATRVAKQMLGVAECFSIDPIVFTSLIGHESFFNHNAVSKTGAIGLGQLTTISLKEIAQQLHADYIPKNERGGKNALLFFEDALSCVAVNLNSSKEFKHWWSFPTKEERNAELKKNTLINLTYSAMIFKISYSKSVGQVLQNGKSLDSVDMIIKKTLNFYNGASATEQLNHYKKTQGFINEFLKTLGETDNTCYKKV